MILLIDNYDSFVYNLARYFEELGCQTDVVRNDAVTVEDIREQKPAAVVLSPGPCTPDESGVSVDLVRKFGAQIPILGVCLGHQVIATAFGGKVVRAEEPVHGRTSNALHDGSGLFAGLPKPLRAARYHSLIIDEDTLPPSLIVTARTADGLVMGLQHRDWPVYGVQFHPESILTDEGHRLLSNFLQQAGLASTVRESSERGPEKNERGDFFQQSIDRDHPPPPGCQRSATARP